MSLRDQLLKAGLVTQDKARQIEADARKQAHRAKKDKTVGAAEAARQAQERRHQEQAAERKRERDRQLNREREQEKQRREEQARIRQLIESQRLNDPGAELAYNFLADGRFIRRVRVTSQQQNQLAAGRIGIARNTDDEYDFPLLPRETAMKLTAIDPTLILVLHPESDGRDGETSDS
ncbi:MAG: DUF2058 domain-containing protein [Gammaproteobacteria bacterium]|nr:DUF2058 domain-containing protein [Gammaproteobacteria bacterium]MCP5425499.1 DUF2058 domain-containing protein [Gammaproteobacteria bacterium]MCP5459381.1 DUF2058 domain-containing protein [Gammaproteobacteria bacterium]